MTTNQDKKNKSTNTILKWVASIVFAPILISGIVGNINMYGTVQRIDERTKDFPSVNGLIITQEKLQHKLDVADHDSFMKMFCKFVEEQKLRDRKLDSVDKSLMKLIKSRGITDTFDSFGRQSWLKDGQKLCKHC